MFVCLTLTAQRQFWSFCLVHLCLLSANMSPMVELTTCQDITSMVVLTAYPIFAQPFIEPSAYFFLVPPIFGTAEFTPILVYTVLEIHGPCLLLDDCPTPARKITDVPSKLPVICVNVLPCISLGCCENHLIVLQ